MSNLKLGLTMRVVESIEHQEIRDALAQDWPLFMDKVLPEALWVFLPNIGKAVIKYVQDWKLNGFIITGGNSLFECPGRDETELALIQFALENSLPVFGICRGLQIMAHYFGYEISPCTGHAGTRHEINISGENHIVNSYHDNCGPLEVNPPLMPFARDNQGHIEGFYHQGKPLMAIMWHPEREKQLSEVDFKLVQNFFRIKTH